MTEALPPALVRVGPALRAMIDRGIHVEIKQPGGGWLVYIAFELLPGGEYERSESASTDDGSGWGGFVSSGPPTTVDALAVERELEKAHESGVSTQTTLPAFETSCTRCAPLAIAVGRSAMRVDAHGGVYVTDYDYREVAQAWQVPMTEAVAARDAGYRDAAVVDASSPEGGVVHRCPECHRLGAHQPAWGLRSCFVSKSEGDAAPFDPRPPTAAGPPAPVERAPERVTRSDSVQRPEPIRPASGKRIAPPLRYGPASPAYAFDRVSSPLARLRRAVARWWSGE